MANLSASTTAVDLSRLPPPTVVEALSFEVIYAEMVAGLQVLLPTFDATVESDPAVKILQLAAYRELMLRQKFNDGARALMLPYAKGADLDNLVALLDVERLELTPANPDTGAAAVMEGDEDLRRRAILAPEGLSVAGPEGAYISNARNAHPDVLDATATSPAPGEVVVTVLSRVGSGAASSEVIAAVTAAVTAEEDRPLTDNVTVQSAQIVNYLISARVYTFSGPDISVVLEASRAGGQAYSDDCHALGRDVTLSGLTAAMHVAGVYKVVIDAPAEDLIMSRLQASWRTGLAVVHAGFAE